MVYEEIINKIKSHIKNFAEGDEDFSLTLEDNNNLEVVVDLGGGHSGHIKLEGKEIGEIYWTLEFSFQLKFRGLSNESINWDMSNRELDEFEPLKDLIPYIEFSAYGQEGGDLGRFEGVDTILKESELFKAHLDVWEYVNSSL